ncbi:MAG: hypothetical protein FJW20_01035 [Acidimicrobiia bacterium]|nr:hypothetical protein [Acidimicrobiia bacterium]
MSVLRPRNRLVNFRLSEDEFEKLKSSCEQFGARSVSDFARSSVLNRIEAGDARQNGSNLRLTGLDQKVSNLETRVDQLIRLLGATMETGATPESVDFVTRELSQSATTL